MNWSSLPFQMPQLWNFFPHELKPCVLSSCLVAKLFSQISPKCCFFPSRTGDRFLSSICYLSTVVCSEIVLVFFLSWTIEMWSLPRKARCKSRCCLIPKLSWQCWHKNDFWCKVYFQISLQCKALVANVTFMCFFYDEQQLGVDIDRPRK